MRRFRHHGCRREGHSTGDLRRDIDTPAGTADLPCGTLIVGRAEGADAVEAETGPALVVLGTGQAGSRAAATGCALIVLRAGQAGTGATGLSPRAVVICDAGHAHAVPAEARGTLVVCGAGGADTQDAEVGGTLVVYGAGATLAIHTHVAGQTLAAVGAAHEGEHAGGITGIAGYTVEETIVTLFGKSDDAIPADRTGGGDDGVLPLATGGAAVMVGGVAVVALFLRQFDNVVAAVAQIRPEAVDGALVAVHEIAVIALLRVIEETVAAAGGQVRLPPAGGGAAIVTGPVAVVALFGGFGDVVAAQGSPLRPFLHTEGIAAVAVPEIAVVALLGRIEETVATGGGRLTETIDADRAGRTSQRGFALLRNGEVPIPADIVEGGTGRGRG